MASSADYARWIVANADKKGTPDFDTVAKAYQSARASEGASAAPAAPAHVNSPEMTAKIGNDQISQDAQDGPSMVGELARQVGNLAGGAVRGAGSIGATLIHYGHKLDDAVIPNAIQRATGQETERGGGPSLTTLVTGQSEQSSDDLRRQAMDEALRSMGVDTEAPAFKVGKLGGEISGTAGAGPAIAGTLRAAPVVGAVAPNLLRAIETAGMSGGTATGATNALTRVAGGAITGGASAGLVDPSTAGTGALVGGVLPGAAKAIGSTSNALGKLVAGPAQSAETAAAVEAARKSGYVIPPTQASPTLLNRALEGFSGKLTTAQNASAANQAVTNAKAAAAIGLPEGTTITPAALDSVRAEAGKAYAQVSKLGALDAAGAKLPASVKVVNSTDPLTMAPKATVDASELVRAWKQANADATDFYRAYGRDANPETLAKAKAASADSKAIDDFLTKSLTTAPKTAGKSSQQLVSELSRGYISPAEFLRQSVAKPADGAAVAAQNQGLLDALKAARVRIAKTYSVEAALNPATGTVDASVLAKQLKKGKVLSDGLKEAGDFASRFPKATQTPEKMGSLPGSSPLDFAAAGGISAATGNPLMMAGVLARPAARALTLSPVVQNRLVQNQSPNALQALIDANPDLALLGYRAAPSALTSR